MYINLKSVWSLILIMSTAPLFAQTYYVATTGNNSYTATQAQNPLTPWATIQKAADNIVGGATVIIAGGTYSEKVTIPSTKSGTVAQRTVFQNATGETVIVDGGKPDPNVGVVNGSNTNRFQSQFKINGATYVTIKGIKVQNVQWYAISAEANAHYAIVDGCITYNSGASGIYTNSSNNIEVINNDVQKACQITTRGASSTGTQECISVVAADYFKISHNEVSNSTVPDDAGGEGIDIKGGTKYGEISYNYVHDIEPLGIYVDAGSFGSGLPCYVGGALPAMSDVRIFSNKVVNSSGLAVAGELGGEVKNIYFYNNIIKDCKRIGFVFNIPGADLVCAGHTVNPIPKTTVGKYTNIYIVNNVFYNSVLADITSNTKNTANSNIVVKNNIFYNKQSSATRTFRFDLFTPFSVSHNLYHDFKSSAQSITPNSNDVNLLDPLFVNATTNNFLLQSSASPAINRATPIYMPNAPTTLMFTTDFADNPRGTSNWDMGAYEFQTVMSVTLTEFKGFRQQSTNHLTWKTSSETHHKAFEVERSTDGNTFKKWATVVSQSKNGNSHTPFEYSIEDNQPLSITTYYRLKLIDFDGKWDYSPTVAIEGTTENRPLSIYPNPANDYVILEHISSDAHIELYDVLGKKIFSQKATTNSLKVDISTLNKGIYFLKVSQKDTDSHIGKFIKE